MRELIEHLVSKLQKLPSSRRYMVGLVGFPGAGKSTLSGRLVSAVNETVKREVAAVVPMDGFHLPNSVLEERELRPLKGVPQTFDGEAFVSMLRQLRLEPAQPVACPCFDRSIDEPTPNGIQVEPHHQLLIVEGNYLLLPQSPWDQVPAILDEVWYIDCDIDTILPRLVDRHVLGGRTTEGARAKVESTDLPNARLIEASKRYATRVVCVDQDEACFSASTAV